MDIALKKFGTTLTSRQSGKEALAAFGPVLKNLSDDGMVTVDFDGVNTFSPSWGDEFLTPLLAKYGEKLKLINTSNPSVQATLDILEETNLVKFNR